MSLLLNVRYYSYKIAQIASILLVILLYAPLILAANDEYIVDNVTVDAEGKDPNENRDNAIAQGQTDAFRQLALRLSPSKANDIISKMTANDISHLIRGFEMVDEKITPTHYHAIIRYSFNGQDIAALFPEKEKIVEKKKLDADEHEIKSVLVLPVYREGEQLKLWQDDNKWRNIWYESALISGGGLIIVPLGDLNDRVDVDDSNVETATVKSLARMYPRYGVAEIYIANAYFNKKADPKPTLEVTLKHLLTTKDDVTRMDFTIHSTEDLNGLMARASSDIAKKLYDIQTINPNKIEFERLKEIKARVNATDIAEWEDLRKRLLAHGNIVGIKLNSISFYETRMTITFKGTPDMLGKTLVASGLRVLQDGDTLVLISK